MAKGISIKKTMDKNNIPRIKNVIKELSENELRVGIFSEGKTELLIIAGVNEFGASINVTPKMRAYLHASGLHLKSSTKQINIPERSFIRGSFDDNLVNIRRLTTRWLNKVMAGEMSIDKFYAKLGESLVGQTKQYLTALKKPSNHPYTLEKKKPKSNPLINTGRLRQSIIWKVEKK